MIESEKYYGQGYRLYMVNKYKKERERKQRNLVWIGMVIFSILIWGSLIYVFLS